MTALAGTVQLGVQAWMFQNIPGMCDSDQPDGFICPSTEVFGTASIVWGVIGPQRQFSQGQVYYALVFFFLIGAFCPAIAYIATIRYPKSWLRYVNFPVIFSGTGRTFSSHPSSWCSISQFTSQSFLPPVPSTTFHGQSLRSSSSMSFDADTSNGGPSTITSFPPPWTQPWLSRLSSSSFACSIQRTELLAKTIYLSGGVTPCLLQEQTVRAPG